MSKVSNWMRKVGLKKKRAKKPESWPFGFHEEEKATFNEVRPYTMTDKRRVLSAIVAVRYIEQHHIEGDIVECGVWKGGSMMAIARTLKNLGSPTRVLHLFDTFEGMVAPTKEDVGDDNYVAKAEYEAKKFPGSEGSDWCFSPLDEVKQNLGKVGYPEHLIRFVKGKVEDTLPGAAPQKIAMLRLDTDWYESTRAEMEHLWPRLVSGGVLIVDDYLYWRGSRQAVDEYITRHGIRILLNPIDGGGVVGVKQA